jgi:hypothetical protein
MPTVASTTLAPRSITFAYVATNLGMYGWVFPTNPTQTEILLPASNTRQMIILNTGSRPLLFGVVVAEKEADLVSSNVLGVGAPYAFSNASFLTAAAAGIVPNEGGNCTRVPVGGSLSVELGSFEQRGSYSPIPATHPTAGLSKLSYPSTIVFFSAVGGDTTADITYINTFGIF